MFNYFLNNSSQSKKEKIILNKEFIKDYNNKINFDLNKNYITWSVRFNKFYAHHRNTNEKEFIDTYILLKVFSKKK